MTVSLPAVDGLEEQSPTPLPRHVWLAFSLLLFAAAVGPIVIREAQLVGLPSLYIITMRLWITSAVLTPFVLRSKKAELQALTRRDGLLVLAGGTLLAINLIMLFLALEYTSVLVTTVLRRTSPLWVIWLEIILLGTMFTRRVWIGLALTLIGSLAIAFGSGTAVQAGSQPVLGALLALVGAICIGLYLLTGRSLRRRISTLTYSWLVFMAAALLTLIVSLALRIPFWGYSLEGYMWVLIVTVVSQFLGHISINVGLRYVHATHLSMVMQVAVVLGAVLALVFFGEIPSPLQIGGSIAIIGGVTLVSLRPSAQKKTT